jgi:hypothetical protein
VRQVTLVVAVVLVQIFGHLGLLLHQQVQMEDMLEVVVVLEVVVLVVVVTLVVAQAQ